MPIQGSCLCGSVKFEIAEVVGPFEICHCNRCRKVSGTSGLAALGVKTEGYRFIEGRELIKTYVAPILNNPPAYETYFCSICGSPLPPPEPEGDWTEVPAGLLDDDPGMKPDKHIFVEFNPEWSNIDDGIDQYTLRQLAKVRYGTDLP